MPGTQGEYNAEGLRHGHGKYVFANGYMWYEGQYANGEKHGLGKLSFKDGGWYEGEFAHDEIHGHGTRRFASGAVFVGSFELGEMHGAGVLTLANGDRFEGVMDHNRMQGACCTACCGEARQHERTIYGCLIALSSVCAALSCALWSDSCVLSCRECKRKQCVHVLARRSRHVHVPQWGCVSGRLHRPPHDRAGHHAVCQWRQVGAEEDSVVQGGPKQDSWTLQ